MSRINTNVSALLAARNLATNQASLNSALQRLSTGLRINSGKDDPAGLIASETLKNESTSINAAIDNAGRADNMISVAEGGLGEVSNLLNQMQDLVDRSANDASLSDDERNANQLQIDSILDSVNRIANTTSFQGKKLLNGGFDYTLQNLSAANIAGVQVNSAKLPEGGSRSVVVEVTTSAQFGQLKFAGAGLSQTNNVTLQIAGNYGTELFSFAGSTHNSAMAYAINQVKELTGVSATTSGAGGADALNFNSLGYGKNAFVSVDIISQSSTDEGFSIQGATGAGAKAEGVDAQVMINGTKAITDGLKASVRTTSLSVDLTLSAAFGSSKGTTNFDIVGGGANFSLAPELSMTGKESIGIASVTTASLGDASTADGMLSSLGTGQANQLSSGNFGTAQRIINAAVKQVASMRGRLGSFQKETLQSTINSLKVAYENTQSAQSAISDADFAAETSSMTRAQILVQSSTSVLKMANQSPQQVLSLLQ